MIHLKTGLSSRFLALVILLATGCITPAQATYSLVWSDEFEGTTLDLSNWTADIGNGCPDLCGWGNNELEYYRAQNVTVTGGNLVLTAREEFYGGNLFTSGKVHTRDKHSFLYGRFEMRAKLPVGGGMWPAFWMMPQDDVYGGWAASGEIDIMESANSMTSVGGALHYGGSYPDNTSTSDLELGSGRRALALYLNLAVLGREATSIRRSFTAGLALDLFPASGNRNRQLSPIFSCAAALDARTRPCAIRAKHNRRDNNGELPRLFVGKSNDSLKFPRSGGMIQYFDRCGQENCQLIFLRDIVARFSRPAREDAFFAPKLAS